uniref:Uncharacterized protein n=1 Tax=Setaria viridis TaxID=4556 RepID=A0A4U6TX94_SETVI|nr:hypothetical protein SEVIR_7G235700v2 [Setaria viridis]
MRWRRPRSLLPVPDGSRSPSGDGDGCLAVEDRILLLLGCLFPVTKRSGAAEGRREVPFRKMAVGDLATASLVYLAAAADLSWHAEQSAEFDRTDAHVAQAPDT